MGKIKKTILSKQDRPVTQTPHPSMRRYKRKNHISNLEPRLSLRGLRRGNPKPESRVGQFGQYVPEVAVFRFKKKHRPTRTLVHKHYSDERKDETSEERVKFLSCRTDDSVRMRRFNAMEKQKLGKIEIKRSKTVWHKVSDQDVNFKP